MRARHPTSRMVLNSIRAYSTGQGQSCPACSKQACLHTVRPSPLVKDNASHTFGGRRKHTATLGSQHSLLAELLTVWKPSHVVLESRFWGHRPWPYTPMSDTNACFTFSATMMSRVAASGMLIFVSKVTSERRLFWCYQS